MVAWLRRLLAEPPTCRLCGRSLVFPEDVAHGECWRHKFLRTAM